MASGSSGRPNSGSKGFDFATDDILCSYEDYSNNNNQDTPNHSDPTNPSKDFPKSRVSRSVFPTTNVYSPPEETVNQELVSTVERTMKKYADNLMRFLEGISSRLSQLELYCYNLDKSIGEMRSDLVRDHGDADSRLKSLEKHLQEVHRSVQILRDKQELAEAQKELAKLQLAQKESSPGAHEEKSVGSAQESKKTDDVSDSPNTQLALALPSQVAPQPSHPTMQQPPPSQNQLPSYYLPSSQLPNNPPTQSQPYVTADSQYRPPQLPPQGPQQAQPQMNQAAPNQQFSQYPQQWPPQQVSQPMRPPQPSQMPPQQQTSPMPPQNEMRAPSPQPSVYSPYMGGGQPPAPETMGGSMPMHMTFPGLSQPGVSRADAMQYGYGGGAGGRPVQAQPQAQAPPHVPPHMKAGFPPQGGGGDGYGAPGTHPPISSAAGTYMVYENEGSQPHHHPPQTSHYPQQGGYPHPHPRPPTSSGLMIRSPSPSPSPPQFLHNHPYNELIDKLVSMGYRADHVVSVIQRLEDSGQPVDFNAVLDRLNGYSSASSQRGGGW